MIGLKWLDVDFEQLKLSVTRSVYRQRVGRCKTEISKSLFRSIRGWLRSCVPGNEPLPTISQRTGSSPARGSGGTQPYSPDSILTRSFRPAAKRAKIAKHIGWHTFRRTFSTLLKANGEVIKTVQELLRTRRSR